MMQNVTSDSHGVMHRRKRRKIGRTSRTTMIMAVKAVTMGLE
jgi:hypothetical protein